MCFLCSVAAITLKINAAIQSFCHSVEPQSLHHILELNPYCLCKEYLKKEINKITCVIVTLC